MQKYDDVYWDLYDVMFADGRAGTLLNQIAASIPATDGLPEKQMSEAVETMSKWVAQRTQFLEKQRAE